MRQVPIKQLYKALSKELDDLPFEITSRGKSIAVVQSLDTGLDQSIEIPKISPKGLDKPKKSRPSKVDDKVIELAPAKYEPATIKWTGGYSKDQQTRKKGKK